MSSSCLGDDEKIFPHVKCSTVGWVLRWAVCPPEAGNVSHSWKSSARRREMVCLLWILIFYGTDERGKQRKEKKNAVISIITLIL